MDPRETKVMVAKVTAVATVVAVVVAAEVVEVAITTLLSKETISKTTRKTTLVGDLVVLTITVTLRTRPSGAVVAEIRIPATGDHEVDSRIPTETEFSREGATSNKTLGSHVEVLRLNTRLRVTITKTHPQVAQL